MIGTALLKKDNISGKNYWITWDEDNYNEVMFESGEPLIFSPEALQVGTRIHLLPPKE